MRWLALLALVAGGCLEGGEHACADGRICSGERACDDIHGGCVLPVQLGCTEGEPCSFPGVVDGRCFDGVCLRRGCGNGVIEAGDGEVCDDGDQAPADGCSPDCRSDETCGNGVLDLVNDEQCDDGATPFGCSDDCRLPACGDGVTEPDSLEQCDDGADNSNSAPDACRVGCRLPFCGDHVHDSGEACDDGNAIAGDGCRPDCQSNETCGNGELDLVAGELCDDGGNASHDGCASACLLETAAWRPALPFTPKGSAVSFAIAEDPTRGVVFGTGWFDVPLMIAHAPGTGELGSNGWVQLDDDPVGPTRRDHVGLAWTPDDGVLLFGGYDGGGSNETWAWDGLRWTRYPVASAPPERFLPAMVRDAARDRVVLFGGCVDSSYEPLADTWEWDGATWTDRTPAGASPAARCGAAVTYDPARGIVVLFGGRDGVTFYDDTWEWDGTTWTERTPATTTPPASATASLAWDAPGGRLVLLDEDTWTWTGDDWALLAAGAPGGPAIYATARGHVVASGAGSTPAELIGDVWVDTEDVTEPSSFYPISGATDVRRDELVAPLGDITYLWRDGVWTSRALPGPPLRELQAMTYDTARAVVLCTGGHDLGTDATLADTWTWDGAAWTEQAAAPARRAAGIAFDRGRNSAVLFGGEDDAGLLSDETWEWDGAAWSDRSGAIRPPARSHGLLAYDAVRARVVLFGGLAVDGDLHDTWEWDGAVWIDRTPALSPSPGVGLVFDPQRGRVVLLGAQTWEWDGAGWSLVPTLDESCPDVVLDRVPGAAAIVGLRSHTSGDTTLFSRGADDLDEACVGFDADGDGLIDCDDPDCAYRCDRCGDAVCDPLETCRLCAGDCGACPLRCGDAFCDPGETAGSCPGDCG